MMLGKRWGCFYRRELFDQLASIEASPGRAHEGVFFLAPPLLEVSFADGLWAELNKTLGTLFDIAEEQVIEPEIGKRAGMLISEFVSKHYTWNNEENLIRLIGTIDGRPVLSEISLSALRGELQNLSAFITDEAIAGHSIVASM